MKTTKVRTKKEYIQHTDLRKYGFQEFRYYTDSTLEHEDQWRQLYLSGGYLDMTDEPRQEEDEVKTDAKSGADIQESRTPPESLVNGPNSKEISSSQVPIDTIKIGNRFRKDLGDIASLAEDIMNIGLLHPIVINHKGELICGLRRIEAFKTLGKRVIPAHIINLDDIVKGEISENIQRKDFSWDEIIQIKKAVEPEIKKESEMRMLSGKDAIGNPYGLEETMTAGIVSQTGRLVPATSSVEKFLTLHFPWVVYPIPDGIQTDAPINQGNGGGPLLNLQGQVIGMNTASISHNDILFSVAGVAQIFWALPMIKGWGLRWYYLGIFGTAALSLSLLLTRVPNGIMSTALIDTNPMALLTDISQFLYIGVTTIIVRRTYLRQAEKMRSIHLNRRNKRDTTSP